MTRGCSTDASLPTNLPASCEARRRLALSRRSLPLGRKTVGLRTIPGREVKAVSKNPAHSEPHAGSGTTQALPVHPWSRRWGYRRGGPRDTHPAPRNNVGVRGGGPPGGAAQAAFRLSAEDLPVFRSATTS